MKNIATLLLLTILLTSCNGFSQKKSPSKEQKEEVAEISDKDKNGLDISSTLLAEIQSKTKKKILPLNREIWNYDRNGNEDNYVIDEGIYFDFVDEITAHDIFNKYSKQVSSNGNYLFLTEMDFDDSYNTYYDVVILKCSSQFDLVKLVGTNGMNYDVYNQDIIDKLTEWHNQVGFEIVVVDGARIHAYMKNLPTDINAFAEEVYEFCPDVIDQGYSSMEEMISDYQNNKYFWLWWD